MNTDLFLSKVSVNEETGCHEWTGVISWKGYGRYGSKRAHRLMWQIVKGLIPAGMFVCHSCDNRKCVNINHLFLGTNEDNLNDAKSKGRLKKDRSLNFSIKQVITDSQKNVFVGQKECAAHYKTSVKKVQDMLHGRRNNRFGLVLKS